MNESITLQCPPSMRPHAEKVLRGEYEVSYTHPAPVILDIGANIGSFALWASKRWPGSTIHCYEPMPANLSALRANTASLGSRVKIYDHAIGDPSHTELFLGKNNCGEASFFQLGEQETTSITVRCEPPTVLPAAQILKVDTEGAELEILMGLPRIDFDVILLEFHSDRDRRSIDALLQDYLLIGGEIRHAHRGVLKYGHKRIGRSVG